MTAAEKFPGLHVEHYAIEGKGWTWNAFIHGVQVKSGDFFATPELGRNSAMMWLARSHESVARICRAADATPAAPRTEATAAGLQTVIPGAEKRQRPAAVQTEFLF